MTLTSFQRNKLSQHWSTFLPSCMLVRNNFYLFTFFLPGSTCCTQMGKALRLFRKAKWFNEFMEGEREKITGAWPSALPAFLEVPKPALFMGGYDFLMALFLSACLNVFVHQAAQGRELSFSVVSKLHPWVKYSVSRAGND